MSKTIYEKPKKDKPLIKNTIIEDLFIRRCTPEQYHTFMDLLSDGTTARATAYASQIVKKWFIYWEDRDKQLNVDLDYVAYKLFKKE